MTNNDTSNDTNFQYYDDEDEAALIPSAQVQFWTYLLLEIPSIYCTIFLLYYLISDRRLRRHLHNHVIIVLLFLCLIILVVDNSFYLDSWRQGHGNSFPASAGVCLLWWFIDYGFYGAINGFLLWASFERHILVFHRRQLLNTSRQIFYIHYLPLICMALYFTGFYFSVIIVPPCKNVFYFNSLACGGYPCYQDISWLSTWDYLFNGVVCNILEAFFSVSLLARTIWKKFYSHRRFHWKKYRKMTIQLLSISTVSLCINLPQSLIVLVQQIRPDMSDFGSTVEPYFFYFTGYIIILLPLVCLGTLSELWPKVLFFKRRHRRMVGPMTISLAAGPTVFVRAKDS